MLFLNELGVPPSLRPSGVSGSGPSGVPSSRGCATSGPPGGALRTPHACALPGALAGGIVTQINVDYTDYESQPFPLSRYRGETSFAYHGF